ncbi:toll/interleukin-1 receptor domain-containing protein [Ralstonia sp. UNC404CL21Col]|uniref:toll/interleukin-1 receptor domain-containing protein n=1 Tax=Ralstonia sp. UNC404CL21Col TaxID=1380362 RepID=UPI000A76B84F|nr:toll/interleukin-1 receptor domain-containing protein [Ralstonia sp. UNC404CL21Col]
MKAPSVFISYSHDSEEHKAWVLRLAVDLRERGVDATLDQWDLVPGQDVTNFMQKGILDADRVILVCSRSYVEKAEGGAGGVGFERLIVSGEVVQKIDTKKFVPLVRANPTEPRIPRFLGPRLYIDFNDDATYEAKRDELLRELLGVPANAKPPLGMNPFSSELPKDAEPIRVVEPTGIFRVGGRLLDEPWFDNLCEGARAGMARMGLGGSMELRFGLHQLVSKSQLDLLNSIRKSQVHTFGWPIGAVLENNDEYRPRPYSDGVRAKIEISKDSLLGRQTYDYWAARQNGDFYLLQSLFEDTRGDKKIFFNTRIVRVAEALMFASNFYSNLGVPPEATLSIRVSHHGLAGRTLSSTGSRLVFPRVCHEDISQSEIVVVLGKIKETIVDDVRRIVEPLFLLFEFQEFGAEIYEDIVRRFIRGEVS